MDFPHSLWIGFREGECKIGELDAAASSQSDAAAEKRDLETIRDQN